MKIRWKWKRTETTFAQKTNNLQIKDKQKINNKM